MNIGQLAKKVINEHPLFFAISFILIANNAANYLTTKYVRLQYSPTPIAEAKKVVEEYNNFDLAKSVTWGSYKAAQEELKK